MAYKDEVMQHIKDVFDSYKFGADLMVHTDNAIKQGTNDFVDGVRTALDAIEKFNQELYDKEEIGSHEWQLYHDKITNLRAFYASLSSYKASRY